MTALTQTQPRRSRKSNKKTPPTTALDIVPSTTTVSAPPAIIVENDENDTLIVRKSPRKNRSTKTAREANSGDEEDETSIRLELTKIDINSTPSTTSSKSFPTKSKSSKSKSKSKSKKSSSAVIITPTTVSPDASVEQEEDVVEEEKKVRRKLIMSSVSESSSTSSTSIDSDSIPALVEASSSSFSEDDDVKEVEVEDPKLKPFVSRTKIPQNVREVYTIVNKMTGNLGGNGSGGAIYGELTVGSMQKMVNLMKEHMDFNENSRFIDVGCGLGKPNLHVAQDPGVEFSYGVEMERVRWLLGMHNLNHVLKAAGKNDGNEIGHKCILAHGNINQAKTFDPFTHVYMFDIGFPPTLFLQLAKMFNDSECNYLICYHGPKLMIDRYGFDVELIVQSSTSMHGSSESHMGYLYKRVEPKTPSKKTPCDKLFREAWKQTSSGLSVLSQYVDQCVHEEMDSSISRRTRSSTRRLQAPR